MMSGIWQLFRQWNRKRLATRQLGKAREYKNRIDLAQRRHYLAAALPTSLPQVVWGVLTRHASTEEQSRCLQGIATACAQAPGLANSLVLTGDDHQPLMAQAFGSGCDAYIAVDAKGTPHPQALLALLRMHQATAGKALIDATLFPQQHSKPFDPNHYDTPWATSACMLLPRRIAEQLGYMAPALPGTQAEGDLSAQARSLGFQVKTCPAALYFMPIANPAALTGPLTPGQITIICRFHDARRLGELQRAVFSLACTDHPDMALIVVTQNFDSAKTTQVEQQIAPIAALAQSRLAIQVVNHQCAPDKDARTELLNLGIAQARGRYLAFLDHDDVIYPEAYSLLIRELAQTGAAIAFGGIVTKHFECFDDISQLRKADPLGPQGSLEALFQMNCCPIHSYVVDRSRIPANELRFDENLVRYEDYEFLLRICARHESSFRHHQTAVGDYYMKDDGSNSTLYLSSSHSQDNQALWLQAKDLIVQRKKTILLSPAVLAQLPMTKALHPPVSIADYNHR